jgi:hypothetical protein
MQSACKDLQVFLLIDDSSSMLSTDPNNQRLEGVRNLLDILAKQYYLPAVDANAKDPGIVLPDIQVSLIRFNSTVHHNSGWKKIDPRDLEAWSAQLDAFDAHLNVEIDYSRSQFTDFRDAFKAAAEMAASQPQDADCPRLLMLFTDGMPNLAGGSLEGQQLTAYMMELRDIVQQTFEYSTDLFFVTAFGSDDAFQNFWNREYRGQWEEIANHTDDSDVPRVGFVPVQELASRMERIVGSIIGERVYSLTPISGEQQHYLTEIPIMVESLRLTYYTIDTSTSFTITGPDGNLVQPDGKHALISGAGTSIQVLEVLKPVPGSYRITTSAPGGLLTQLLRFERVYAELSSPLDPWLQFTNEQIAIQLFSADGRPLLISPQISIQAALIQTGLPGAGRPKFLPLTLENNTYTTHWMPIRTEPALVYACATLDVDSGRSVILHNGLVGEIQIDPVTVQAEQPRETCVPTDKMTNQPLQLINGRTQEPVTIDSPVQWSSRSSGFPGSVQLSSSIEEVDAAAGQYVLRFKPVLPGDMIFAVKAAAFVEGVKHTFYDQRIPPIAVDPPRQLELALGQPDTLADKLSIMLYRWFNPTCIDEDTKIVIGRRMFGWFGPTDVQLNARFLDVGTGLNEPCNGDQPCITDFAARLVSLEGGPPTQSLKDWTAAQNEVSFSTLTFNSPGLGLYTITLSDDRQDFECTQLDSLPTQNVLLINDFWEYVVILSLVLILALFVLYVLRRYRKRGFSHEIPLILSAIVLIVLNILLVDLLVEHTFKCELNCAFLVDDTLNTAELGISLCSEGLKVENIIGERDVELLWGLIKFKIGPFPIRAIPILGPLAETIDPRLEDLRQWIIKTILILIGLASLVSVFFLKRLLTPEGRRAILTYLGLWLLFFVLLSGMFYFSFVR